MFELPVCNGFFETNSKRPCALIQSFYAMEVSYNASFEIAKPFHSLEFLLLNLFLKGYLLKSMLKTNILKMAKKYC